MFFYETDNESKSVMSLRFSSLRRNGAPKNYHSLIIPNSSETINNPVAPATERCRAFRCSHTFGKVWEHLNTQTKHKVPQQISVGSRGDIPIEASCVSPDIWMREAFPLQHILRQGLTSGELWSRSTVDIWTLSMTLNCNRQWRAHRVSEWTGWRTESHSSSDRGRF